MIATKEQYLNLRQKCEDLKNNTLCIGFQEINFVDYTKYLQELKILFPTLIFIQKDYGIIVDKKGTK